MFSLHDTVYVPGDHFQLIVRRSRKPTRCQKCFAEIPAKSIYVSDRFGSTHYCLEHAVATYEEAKAVAGRKEAV